MGEATAHPVAQAVGEGRRAYVLVNNRTQGHAPGTMKALYRLLADHTIGRPCEATCCGGLLYAMVQTR